MKKDDEILEGAISAFQKPSIEECMRIISSMDKIKSEFIMNTEAQRNSNKQYPLDIHHMPSEVYSPLTPLLPPNCCS